MNEGQRRITPLWGRNPPVPVVGRVGTYYFLLAVLPTVAL